MNEERKGKVIVALVFGVIAVWVAAFIWVFASSTTCNEAVPMAQTEGWCLWRRIMGLSCFAGWMGAWGALCAYGMKLKGRSPVAGFFLGFFLNFLGGIIVLMQGKKEERAKPHPCPRCGKETVAPGLCWDCFVGKTPS
jgi:hypothetical protein